MACGLQMDEKHSHFLHPSLILMGPLLLHKFCGEVEMVDFGKPHKIGECRARKLLYGGALSAVQLFGRLSVLETHTL